MLGKAFPYPQRVQVWCFARGSRRTEPGYGASRAYGTSSRPQLQCSGCCYPPRPGHRFSRSLGPLARVLALVAYASRAEPGSYRGEVVNGPKCWTYKPSCAGVKVGARIAPNAFATADGGDCTEALRRFQRAGASLWAVAKACRNHTRQPPRCNL